MYKTTSNAHTLVVGASIGVALYPDHGAEAVELFRHADEAMYRAKRDGRNRVQIFDLHAARPPEVGAPATATPPSGL